MIADWSEPVDPHVDGMSGLPAALLAPEIIGSVATPVVGALVSKLVGKDPSLKQQETLLTKQMKLEAAQLAAAQTRRQATVLWVIGGVAVVIAGVFVIAALWGRKKKDGVAKHG